MKKTIHKTFLLLFLISSCAVFSQKNTPEKLKKEALSFSLEFIQDIFSNDCEKVIDKFHDRIFSINDNEFYKKGDVEEEICEAIKDVTSDKSKTYANYLTDYKTEILSPAEAQKRFDLNFPSNYFPMKNDYFFIGTDLKDSTKRSYIYDDLFVLLVRKEKRKWSIIGIGE